MIISKDELARKEAIAHDKGYAEGYTTALSESIDEKLEETFDPQHLAEDVPMQTGIINAEGAAAPCGEDHWRVCLIMDGKNCKMDMCVPVGTSPEIRRDLVLFIGENGIPQGGAFVARNVVVIYPVAAEDVDDHPEGTLLFGPV